jgi:hypothetical protein
VNVWGGGGERGGGGAGGADLTGPRRRVCWSGLRLCKQCGSAQAGWPAAAVIQCPWPTHIGCSSSTKAYGSLSGMSRTKAIGYHCREAARVWKGGGVRGVRAGALPSEGAYNSQHSPAELAAKSFQPSRLGSQPP